MTSTTILSIHAREILDSRGHPTVEVELKTSKATVTASVPEGASTGIHEAMELRDHAKRYHGLGVQKSVRIINTILAPKLKGKDCTQQQNIDKLLIALDGTDNKHKYGANTILAISIACAKAAAASQQIPLYYYLHRLANIKKPLSLPTPYFNILNGGKHADSSLSFQEFMIVPKLKTFQQNLQAGAEIYHTLKQILHHQFGSGSTNVGDEGGFSCSKIKTAEQALDLISKAISLAGYKKKCALAIDAAASSFYKKDSYLVDGKKRSAESLLAYYRYLASHYNIISIEDPFEQEDVDNFGNITAQTNLQIVTDDLTVTNLDRLEWAIHEHAGTCLLVKPNQIGTLTETLQAVQTAYEHHWNVIVSHRSGETEDTFIADLAVALGCDMIKAGAPCRGERVAKYNHLLRIEEEIKD